MDEYKVRSIKFKKKLDKYEILKKHIDNKLLKEKNIIKIKKTKLSKLISKLPKDIQILIYKKKMKELKEKQILYNTLKPIYYDYYKYIQEEKYKVLFKNINIMHLDCNTLPENKKYISGCQCDFCKNHDQEYKNKIYNFINYNENKFYETLGLENVSWWGVNYLSLMINNLDLNNFENQFNFMKGNFHSHYDPEIKDSPLYFSYETLENLKVI